MTFARLLSEALAAEFLPSTGDVLAIGIPLLEQLNDLHRSGLVSKLNGLDHLEYDGRSLQFDSNIVQLPRRPDTHVAVLNPLMNHSGVRITSRISIGLRDGVDGEALTSDDVFDSEEGRPGRPMFLIGYRVWEQTYDHHDELTDIALAGLLLTSYATGLDLDLEQAVHQLALSRSHMLRLNPSLHPVVAGVLSDMIAPDRHQRPDDLTQVIARLQHHRELPTDLNLSEVYQSAASKHADWRLAVLGTLRERVFDTSRRNRALYFRYTATALSLTEASVPLLLSESRIRPEDLLTWTGTSAEAFRRGKPVKIEQWCRFEENPYLTTGLDKLISSERKLRAEHGQGRLHLIIAFLRWYDPANDEVVNSPLLLMPAELQKRKGVKPRYLVEVDQRAEVNPILRHVLRSRFDIHLAEEIDSDPDSIKSFVADLERAVQANDPGLRVDLIEKPQISLIRRRAQLRVAAYHRRRAQALASSGRWRRQDHSYDLDDWRPLGLSLYRRFVEPTPLPLRTFAGAPPSPRQASRLSAATAQRIATTYSLATGDVHGQRWEVDLCAVTLASLGSRRTTISRDYDELLDTPATELDERFSGSPFVQMFSPEPRRLDAQNTPPISLDQMLVLPADAAQAKAVRRGIRGDSFIIQGPPGTGKSQTITNLIAALVGDGKRVLFVCEKRAALDVVAHRLRQVGLNDLVATIHDSQLDRRTFIADLGQTYDAWLNSAADSETGTEAATVGADRSDLLGQAMRLLSPLEHAFDAINRNVPGATRSAAELVERIVLLRSSNEADQPVASGTSVAVDQWLASRPQLGRVESSLVSAGLLGDFSTHPALRVHPAALLEMSGGAESPILAIEHFGRELSDAVRSFLRLLPPTADPQAITTQSLGSLVSLRTNLELIQKHRVGGVLDPHGTHFKALDAAESEQQRLGELAQQFDTVLTHWGHPFSPEDTANAIQVAVSKEGSILGFLNGRWRRTNKAVHEAYRFDDHQVPPTVTQVLTELSEYHQANANLVAFRGQLTKTYGTTDLASIRQLSLHLEHNPVVTSLVKDPTIDPDAYPFSAISPAAERIRQLAANLVSGDQMSLQDLGWFGQQLQTIPLAIERALADWAALDSVPDAVLAACLSLPDAGPRSLDQIELGILEACLDRAHQRGLLSPTGAQLDRTVDALLSMYGKLLDANAAFIAEQAMTRFARSIAFAGASMAGRSDADKKRKRAYNAGRKLLEREFQKKSRFRSIRDLASGESGLVVRDLKPIWLMSPLSVSDTLPLDDDLFDVVIFDEASQIPVEDAVPTIFRARQVVVVGDRMQLPPTRFFSAESDEDDEIIVDDGGHRLAISLKADSFLAQSDLSLESTMLTWHYRSRFESLIAYSNHAFYDAQLATVPDRQFDPGELPAITVESAEDARTNLAATLARPISFHKLDHGVYGERRNEAEADYIAELVRSLLLSGTSLTIGIVAFSEAQQTAIEAALAELATLDRSFNERFTAEQIRSDDGEFVGLFVKNLENVQGDERDLIIMSVCYAPTANGKMRMNFGPINQSGGERRLNVIFSRAKQHMAIISSITGSHITNTHNDGAANLAQFLDYAAAESQGLPGVADGLLRALRPHVEDLYGSDHGGSSHEQRSAIATAMALLLRARGWVVDIHVGRSVFTVDLAVRGRNGYQLGVMIDPGASGSPATTRLVAEASVLRAFDWPVTRIFATEWLDDPEVVLDRIELTLGENQ